MKKKFSSLLYTGLLLVSIPTVFVSILIILPLVYDKNKQPEPVTHVKVYDTITVKKIIKVYDTIPVQKIKWIEKVKTDTTSN